MAQFEIPLQFEIPPSPPPPPPSQLQPPIFPWGTFEPSIQILTMLHQKYNLHWNVAIYNQGKKHYDFVLIGHFTFFISSLTDMNSLYFIITRYYIYISDILVKFPFLLTLWCFHLTCLTDGPWHYFVVYYIIIINLYFKHEARFIYMIWYPQFL